MGNFFKQVQGIWQRMETPQRVSMILIAVVFVGIIAAVGIGASRPDFSLLASGLTQTETARIASYLADQNVPYKLVDRDTAILVPRSQRYQLLNVLAEQELLTDASDGFEILADGGMGETSFMERKRYDRALSGELARAIREIDGVQHARVLVNRPKESPFIEEEGSASAAVKLTMKTGRRVSERQLAGIIHLVAGAVGGIEHDQIQVMDDQGLLTRPDQEHGALAASTSLEAERAMEQHLMGKAQAVLDRVLGAGRSLVTVAVDLDFAKRTEAASMPTDPVMVETHTRETDESTPVPIQGGLAGTVSNVESANTGSGATSEPATKTSAEETVRYATGKKTTTLADEVGRIRGMTVSVLLDHQREKREIENDDGETVVEEFWQPFSDADRKRFEELVLDAIGFEAAKGAQLAVEPNGNAASRFAVTVQSMRFEQPEEDPVVEPDPLKLLEEYDAWLRYGGALLVALALLLVARGQLKRSHAAWQREVERREVERRQAEEAAKLPEEEVKAKEEEHRRLSLRQEIQKQVTEDPDSAAAVLRGWIHNAV